MDQDLVSWLSFAEADLFAAEDLLQNKRVLPAISVYHSHQCIEKLFKAILIKHNQSVPKIHNLNKLLLMTAVYVKDLDSLENQITDINELFPLLRYPTGDQITAEDARKSYETASLLFQKLAQHIQ